MRNMTKFWLLSRRIQKHFIVKKELEEESVLRLQKEGVNFKVVNGNRYLGGFVGDTEKEREWIEEKMKEWVKAVEAVAEVSKYVPQSAYAGMQRAFSRNGHSCKESYRISMLF